MRQNQRALILQIVQHIISQFQKLQNPSPAGTNTSNPQQTQNQLLLTSQQAPAAILEETDLQTSLIQEIDLQKLENPQNPNQGSSPTSQHPKLFAIVHAMLDLGLITRPTNALCPSKFLQWAGMKNMQHTILDRFYFTNAFVSIQECEAVGCSFESMAVLLYLGIIQESVNVTQDNTQLKGYILKKDIRNLTSLQELEHIEIQLKTFKIEYEIEPSKFQPMSFDNSGFALLKGRNWKYFMPKLYCIIGRSPINYRKKGKMLGVKVIWQVDVDLGHQKKVSRQHCLIVYNFEAQKFEVKCLSRKYHIRVNGKKIGFKDSAKLIDSGDILQVGEENFFFMMPSKIDQQSEQDQAEQNEQAEEEQKNGSNCGQMMQQDEDKSEDCKVNNGQGDENVGQDVVEEQNVAMAM